MSDAVEVEPMSPVFTLQALLDEPLIYWLVDDVMERCDLSELRTSDFAYDRVCLLIPGTVLDDDDSDLDSNAMVRRTRLEFGFQGWVYCYALPDGQTGLFLHTNATVPRPLAVLVKNYYEETVPAV